MKWGLVPIAEEAGLWAVCPSPEMKMAEVWTIASDRSNPQALHSESGPPSQTPRKTPRISQEDPKTCLPLHSQRYFSDTEPNAVLIGTEDVFRMFVCLWQDLLSIERKENDTSKMIHVIQSSIHTDMVISLDAHSGTYSAHDCDRQG